MSSTPIATAVARDMKDRGFFKALPTEYTDRYTPESARQLGIEQGWRDRNNEIIAKLKGIAKPTKQVLDLLAELEKEGNE
jgi:hypothetical protein